MKQLIIFSKEELEWMLTGGVVSAKIADAKHEYMLDSTYERRRGEHGGTIETSTKRSS